jgi:hypothetical protein
MRHIYKIFPSERYDTIEQSINSSIEKYTTLISESGVVNNGINYRMTDDDLALLYRQTEDVTSETFDETNCVVFGVALGKAGYLSLEEYVTKTEMTAMLPSLDKATYINNLNEKLIVSKGLQVDVSRKIYDNDELLTKKYLMSPNDIIDIVLTFMNINEDFRTYNTIDVTELPS